MALFGKELSFRALLLGALLSVAVCMYSAFAGLKVGGVYWPIVTTSIIALAVLKLLGGTNKNEINIMQTAGSAGGLLAAGIIFTVPAAWMLGFSLSILDIVLVALAGGLLGVVFSIPLREEMIEREKLPYPDGAAAAAAINAGDEGGGKAKTLLAAFGLGGLVAVLRDYLAVIPGFINLSTLKLEAAKLFSLGSAVSVIPFAGGFLIGPLFTGAWFLGAVISYFLVIPYVVSVGMFADVASAKALTTSLGVGVVIGASVAYFLLKALPSAASIVRNYSRKGFDKLWGLGLIVCVGLLLLVTGADVVLSVIALLGAFLMAYVGARVTGEMNVDPMEIFAMIVLLVVKLAFAYGQAHLLMLAAIVCISAGIAGDFLQDLKTGSVLGTKPEHQVVAQLVGVVASALVIGLVLVALQQTYGFGGVDLPAPQAVAVSSVIGSTSLSVDMLSGAVVGFLLTLATTVIGLGIVPIAFGIGLYVPIELSFPLFLGGLIRLYVDRRKFADQGRLLAAGLIAGEGFIGVLIALAAFLGGVLLA